MTWRGASFAESKRPWLWALLPFGRKYPQTSAASCPTAQRMRQTPLPDERQSTPPASIVSMLERRGMMIHNRNRKAAAEYVRRNVAIYLKTRKGDLNYD